MALTVHGIGMVSAAGARARDHAFFPRAEAPPPAASPFKRVDGRRWSVQRCRWIGPLQNVGERLVLLAVAAADEALENVPAEARRELVVHLCLPAPRAHLTDLNLEDVGVAVAKHVGVAAVTRHTGAARAIHLLSELGDEPALVVAVDSFVSLADATGLVDKPPSPFLMQPAPPGEGAAAILIHGKWGVPPIARIESVAAAVDAAHDDNDVPSDAGAMTQVVQALVGAKPVTAVFGQLGTDHLRVHDWERTVARLASRFDGYYESSCLELEVGQLGSAAGIMNLCHAIASLRHRVVAHRDGVTLAWAISRDGLRAGASVTVSGTSELVALEQDLRARAVMRTPFVASPSEPDDDEGLFAEDEIDPGMEPADADGVLEEIDELMRREAANDVAPAAVIAPAPRALARDLGPIAAVFIDEGRASPTPLPSFYEEVVRHTCDTSAMLLQDRLVGAWHDVPEAERRLRCQLDAVVAVGGDALGAVARWWDGEIDDAWSAYAATLMALSFEGADAHEVVLRGAEQIIDEDVAAVAAMSEALRLGAPEVARSLIAPLSASDAPVARALALATNEADVDAVLLGLTEDEDVLRRAAVWACDRLPPELRDDVTPHLELQLELDDAWPAARQLALWGHDGGLGRLDALGPHVADMFVLRGGIESTLQLEDALRGLPPTPGLIDGVARFGAPRLVPWLLSLFSDEVLAEHSARGLATMFGALVPDGAYLDHTAWREAIAQQPIDDAHRYRRGRVWSPAVVIDELGDTTLSRAALELRVDELRARADLPPPALSSLFEEAAQQLGTFVAAARRATYR